MSGDPRFIYSTDNTRWCDVGTTKYILSNCKEWQGE